MTTTSGDPGGDEEPDGGGNFDPAALCAEQACEIMAGERARHFDPDLLDVFLLSLDEMLHHCAHGLPVVGGRQTDATERPLQLWAGPPVAVVLAGRRPDRGRAARPRRCRTG